MHPRNVLYAQSGGVTSVINASAAGVIAAARRHGDQVGTVYGARNGIIGALREELLDTGGLSDDDVAALEHTPGGAFGSCRYKLPPLEKDRRPYERLIEVFRAHEIGYFLYNGGGDSSDTALKVSGIGAELGFPVRCIAVPKTVDNDLALTDHCPGFGSVAKYVATALMEATLDVRSMAESSTKVFVMEVMGRHAGWIAASGGLARRGKGIPPALILFPERTFDEAAFLTRVDEHVREYGFCTVVVSEGVRNPDGQFLADSGTTDAFGHKQLGGVAPLLANMITEKTGHKNHWAVLDYLQRSGRHLSSAVDLAHAYAVGKAAVEFAVAGRNAVMPIIERVSDEPYEWRVGVGDLGMIANVEKKVPDDYITEDGFGITEACRRYLAPLIQGEAFPPFVDGLPDYRVLDLPQAERALPPFEV